MDVHAPHEPVHSWRDFFTHIAIVTIGLFIALMLEALVEHMHHQHLVAEARENLHREIAENCDNAQKDLSHEQANVKTIENNIKTIHIVQDNPDAKGYSVENTMEWNDFSSAAWRTAHETGALSFMPYDEVQKYSDLYTSQDFIEGRAEALFDRDILALAPFKMGIDPAKLSADDFHTVLKSNAEIQVELLALGQIVQQYHDRCQAAVQGKQ